MINLHQLRVYAAVIEEASFTAAAARLFLTQPAVSAQIRRLRQIVGSPLVARDGHRVVATEAGNALYRYACDVLASTESLWQELRELSSGAIDHVMVGGSQAYGEYVLPELLVRFRRGHPGIQFSLVGANTQDIVSQVRSGRLDMGVVTSDRVPQDLVVSRIGADDPIIIDSVSNPVLQGDRFQLEDLSGLPFVRMRIGPSTTDAVDRLLQLRDLPPSSVAMEITTWEGIKVAVRDGVGLAAVPRAVVREELKRREFRIIDVGGFERHRQVFLICSPRRRARYMPPIFRALLEFLQQELPGALNQEP